MAEEIKGSMTGQCWIVVLRILRFFMFSTFYPMRNIAEQKKKTMLGNVDHFIDLLEALEAEKETAEQASQQVLKIIASCSGDPTVGIFGCDMSTEIPKEILEDDQNDENRYQLRKMYAEFAATIFDEAPVVWFSDECPDCQKVRVDNECKNSSCISYRKKLRNL